MTKAKAKAEAKPANPYFDLIRTGRAGRPRMVLNDEGAARIEELASIGCTKAEIAAQLGVSEKTLDTPDNRDIFSKMASQGYNLEKISLRRLLHRQAENGNVRAAIFLAKNILGMSDNPRVEVKVETDTKVISKAEDLTYDDVMELIREGRIRSGPRSHAHVR